MLYHPLQPYPYDRQLPHHPLASLHGHFRQSVPFAHGGPISDHRPCCRLSRHSPPCWPERRPPPPETGRLLRHLLPCGTTAPHTRAVSLRGPPSIGLTSEPFLIKILRSAWPHAERTTDTIYKRNT